MNRPRLVTVEFVNKDGQHKREDYVFHTPAQMVAWLERIDDPKMPEFGVHAVMTVRYCAVADVPAQRATKTATRRTRNDTRTQAQAQAESA